MNNKIEITNYEITDLTEKKQFKFSLVTKEIQIFQEYYTYGERDKIEELTLATKWFEKLVAKEIFLCWEYYMFNNFKQVLIKDVNKEELIEKIYERFNFFNEDVDQEFYLMGFILASYFEENKKLYKKKVKELNEMEF